MAGEVTPEQISKANDFANKVIDELWQADTAEECAAICQANNAGFERLRIVHPVRAIHIQNLVALKRREFGL